MMTWKQFIRLVEDQIAGHGIDIARTRVEINYIDIEDDDEIEVHIDKREMPSSCKITIL